MPEPEQPFVKKRAPTLYGIITFKLVKGALFATLALTAYALSDNNLPEDFQKLMNFLQVHPANQFFARLGEAIGRVTQAQLLWTALGTIIYSSFSFIEGIGMMFRQGWAGWLAIAESGFFIPIEIYELSHTASFSWGLLAVLMVNILIVWYLFANRNRLFKHHLHADPGHSRHQD